MTDTTTTTLTIDCATALHEIHRHLLSAGRLLSGIADDLGGEAAQGRNFHYCIGDAEDRCKHLALELGVELSRNGHDVLEEAR